MGKASEQRMPANGASSDSLHFFWKIGNFILGTKQFSSELAKVYGTDCTRPSLIVCPE